jgi:hypothetical protein
MDSDNYRNCTIRYMLNQIDGSRFWQAQGSVEYHTGGTLFSVNLPRAAAKFTSPEDARRDCAQKAKAWIDQNLVF